MSAIYTIGETIYDIIFKDGEPVAAKAGGSMLNTAVSLGRLGLPVHFVSEYGLDQAGDNIDEFLSANGVNTGFVHRYDNGKTPIALAFLNERNDARYTFYKLYPQKRFLKGPLKFAKDDIVLFGAFYSLLPEIRKEVLRLVEGAKKAGALIIYDPNIRSPHKDQIGDLRSAIYENFSLADIVRGSDEDFNTMFGIDNGEDAFKLVKENGCDLLIYTRSDTSVESHKIEGMMEINVPAVKTISTIGAGDSFNAGLIYELFEGNITPSVLQKTMFTSIIDTAISFGSHVCTHYENYIAKEYADKVRGSGFGG